MLLSIVIAGMQHCTSPAWLLATEGLDYRARATTATKTNTANNFLYEEYIAADIIQVDQGTFILGRHKLFAGETPSLKGKSASERTESR
jgi:hypothetical protein